MHPHSPPFSSSFFLSFFPLFFHPSVFRGRCETPHSLPVGLGPCSQNDVHRYDRSHAHHSRVRTFHFTHFPTAPQLRARLRYRRRGHRHHWRQSWWRCRRLPSPVPLTFIFILVILVSFSCASYPSERFSPFRLSPPALFALFLSPFRRFLLLLSFSLSPVPLSAFPIFSSVSLPPTSPARPSRLCPSFVSVSVFLLRTP